MFDSHSVVVVVLQAVVVQRHEYDVDDDAEGDEELGEGVEHDEGQDLAHSDPQPAAVPDAGHVRAFHGVLSKDGLRDEERNVEIVPRLAMTSQELKIICIT